MATAPDPAPAKQIDKLLECSICIETITEPRTLSCFHSFCKHCLAKFVATQKEAVEKGAKVPEVFECPVCRTKFRVKEGESIENMPPNHFINNLLELLPLTQQDQSIKCQSCKARNPAASRCVSCENYLCEKCLEAHNNWPAFEDHVVLTLEELAKPENRAKARGKPRCEKHNKVLKFYCQTCKVLACRNYTDVNHPRPEHLLLPLTDVVAEHKKSLNASCAIFEQQTNEAFRSSLKIKDAIATLRNNATKTKEAIMQQRTELQDAFVQQQEKELNVFKQQQQEILDTSTKNLEQETAVLLDQVDVKYNKANEPLTHQQADVKDYLEKARSSLDFAKNIICSGSDENILSLKQVIEEKAGSIENERPEYMEPVHNGAIEYQANRSEPSEILVNVKFDNLGKVVSPLLKQEEEEEAKEKEEEAKRPVERAVQCLCERSKILNGDVNLARKLAEWLKDNIFGWNLGYRATDDGWRSGDFHRKCDTVGPTVTLVKCGISVFGGFTYESWTHPDIDPDHYEGPYELDVGYKRSDSFLFSLRNKDNIPPFKCPIYDLQRSKAMYCSRMYGVIFGGGHDLYVSSDANTNQDSYSNLGYTYQPPAGYKPGTPQTKSLLAGSEYFTPTEVEVFCN